MNRKMALGVQKAALPSAGSGRTAFWATLRHIKEPFALSSPHRGRVEGWDQARLGVSA
jgi:hypothetical protein